MVEQIHKMVSGSPSSYGGAGGGGGGGSLFRFTVTQGGVVQEINSGWRKCTNRSWRQRRFCKGGGGGGASAGGSNSGGGTGGSGVVIIRVKFQ